MSSKLTVLLMVAGMLACSKARLENVIGENNQIISVAPPASADFAHPPTADVEVVDPDTGNSTTVVVIGKDYFIRPTVDTVDSDGQFSGNIGEVCKNDGIKTVQVSVLPASEGSNITSQRQGCQDGFEDITYRFTQAGQSTITLIATTDEAGDSAKAVATVEVVDPNVNYNGSDWFDLSGTKLALKLGADGKSEPITFRGFCQTFGIPGSVYVHPEPGKKLAISGQTYSVTHQYEKVGVYEVRGFCFDANRDLRESVITVVVLPEDGSQIAKNAIFRGDDFNFNDFPGQNSPGQNSPGQN